MKKINLTISTNTSQKTMSVTGKLYFWETVECIISGATYSDVNLLRMAVYDGDTQVCVAGDWEDMNGLVGCVLPFKTEEMRESFADISPNSAKKFTVYLWNEDGEEMIAVGTLPIYNNPYIENETFENVTISANIFIQYSPDGTTWSDSVLEETRFIRISTDFGKTYGDAICVSRDIDVSFDNNTKEIVLTKEGQESRDKVYGIFDSVSYENGILTIKVSGENGEESNSVNIPVENFLSSVNRKVVSQEDLDSDNAGIYGGCSVGDVGIFFEMQDGTQMFVPLDDLIDKYVPANGNGPITVVISGYNVSANLNYNSEWLKTDVSNSNCLTLSDKFISDFDKACTIEEEIIPFNSNYTLVNGEYRFTVNGYVASVYTYVDNDSSDLEMFMVKKNYDRTVGTFGTSYVYFASEEFEYFSQLSSPKNVFKVFVIRKITSN